MELTQEYLKSVLHYDTNSGIFTRLAITTNSVKIGDVAGTMRHGYVMVGVASKQYRAHQLAWFYITGKWPDHEIDHINRIKHDNRWENLRKASRSQNLANSSVRCASGYKGAYPKGSRWQSKITVSQSVIYLGSFDTKEAAHSAYCAAADKYFGEYANHG
jgi:hypothetical protein